MSLTRRQFLGTSATAVIVAGTKASGKVFGANDRVNVGCIGIHGQGNSHIGAYLGMRAADVVALCDVDEKVLGERAAKVRKARDKAPKTYTDLRELLDNKEVDAVSIATPNHWHTLASMWALQAGKHVYVEKPMSHNIWEGRQLVNAANKHGKVVMHGTQRRSDANWLRTVQALRDGVIGNVYMARALCFKNRGSIGTGQEVPPPDHLHWHTWQGPAQERAYRDHVPKKGDRGIFVHYNWHWFWDYGNGDIGNQGVHQMDIAVWGLNVGLPVKVHSAGGRYTYEDEGETPNTMTTTFTYEDGRMLVFEVRGRASNYEEDTRVGNLFYGSNGYFAEADEGKNRFRFHDAEGQDIKIEKTNVDTKGSFGNYIRVIQSGKEEDNFAPALAGHISSAHCHLANISYRLGRSLTFDPKTETFPGDDEANALLFRNYREPFVVPEIS